MRHTVRRYALDSKVAFLSPFSKEAVRFRDALSQIGVSVGCLLQLGVFWTRLT